jgi:hypothetical protein
MRVNVKEECNAKLICVTKRSQEVYEKNNYRNKYVGMSGRLMLLSEEACEIGWAIFITAEGDYLKTGAGQIQYEQGLITLETLDSRYQFMRGGEIKNYAYTVFSKDGKALAGFMDRTLAIEWSLESGEKSYVKDQWGKCISPKVNS